MIYTDLHYRVSTQRAVNMKKISIFKIIIKFERLAIEIDFINAFGTQLEVKLLERFCSIKRKLHQFRLKFINLYKLPTNRIAHHCCITYQSTNQALVTTQSLGSHLNLR